MGTCSSSSGNTQYRTNKTTDVFSLQETFEAENLTTIPIEICVAHYTPASFPMNPKVSSTTSRVCEESWEKIVANDAKDELGRTLSGLTIFYNEFYERLDQLDNTGKFEAVLSRGSSGSSNKAEAKGEILVRIIKFVLKIDADNYDNQLILYMLGKSHSQKHIRPWQYATFVQTLLYTIASRLGPYATNEVMEAWVNLFGFIMKSMLPAAIRGQVVETELNINTSSEFAAGKLAEEVQDIEDAKEVRRKMKKANGSMPSSTRDSVNSDRRSVQSASIHGSPAKGATVPPLPGFRGLISR